MPVQLFDAATLVLDAQRTSSVWAALRDNLTADDAYLRPLHPTVVKALFDLAQGHYWLVYRGFHALMVVVSLWLFLRALRVRTATDLCAAAFALTVLTGTTPFRDMLRDAYPVSHHLVVVVCCLGVLNLAQAAPRRATDVAAVLLFGVAALMIESGLLVWVVAVAAWLSGSRGVSRNGLALMTVALVGYLCLRFTALSVVSPGLDERSSGYLFARLDPQELEALFGDRLAVFYAYNVLSSFLSVVLAEPRDGVFVAVNGWLTGDTPARDVLGVLSTLGTSLAIGWTSFMAARHPTSRGPHTVLLVTCGAVVVANSVLSFAYVKDQIMCVAAVFYALAAYAAATSLVGSQPRRGVAAVVVTALLLTTAPLWAVRSAGIHHALRVQAFNHRNDWAHMPGTWQRNGDWPADPAEQRLMLQLRDDAIGMRGSNPVLAPRWMNRVWGD
jgi:hypothetical protein